MILAFTGILISVILLITLAYRGWSVVIAAPLCASVAILFSAGPLLGSYTEVFMPALGNFAANYLPIFLTGAVFGRLMTLAGYAEKIASVLTRTIGSKYAILATVLSTAILTYGGVSSFVVVFAAYPVARELFREAGIPRRLMPATLMLGLATFTMSALPGTPQVQNIIPSQFFGTSTFAAPVIGIVGGALIFGLGVTWLEYRSRTLRSRGETFEHMLGGPTGKDTTAAPTSPGAGTAPALGAAASSPRPLPAGPGAPAPGAVQQPGKTQTLTSATAPVDEPELRAEKTLVATSSWPPFAPLVTVIVLNFVSSRWLIPSLDTDYLGTGAYGERTLAQVSGTWAVLIAMLVAILLVFVLNLREHRFLFTGLAEGARNATLPLVNTGSEVGYGAVITSLAAFAVFQNWMTDLIPNALVSSIALTMATAGITGSATGGVSIALNSFGPELIQRASEQGISLDVMHRLTAMAAGSFDTLPHNGAVIVVLLVTGLTHRQAYKDIAMVTVVAPLAVVAALVPFALWA